MKDTTKKTTTKKTTTKKTTTSKTTAKKTTKTTTKKATTKTTKKSEPAPKVEKKRLIVSYKNLQEKDMELFNTTYAEGFMDYIQRVEKPDGTPMFLVPLETQEAYLMVKVEVRVEENIAEDDFDKDYDDKEEETTLDDIENGKNNQNFKLIHGDYSTEDRLVEEQANKDMSEEESMHMEDVDEVDVIDPDTID